MHYVSFVFVLHVWYIYIYMCIYNIYFVYSDYYYFYFVYITGSKTQMVMKICRFGGICVCVVFVFFK